MKLRNSKKKNPKKVGGFITWLLELGTITQRENFECDKPFTFHIFFKSGLCCFILWVPDQKYIVQSSTRWSENSLYFYDKKKSWYF